MLGIRVGVPHLTKFDVGGVRRWKGVRHWGVALMHSVSRGIDAPGLLSYVMVCIIISCVSHMLE